MFNQLDHRRLQARVDRAATALTRGKTLEGEVYESLLHARLALDGQSWANSRIVADALRRGTTFEIPADDGALVARCGRLEAQLNCLRRACMTLRSEFQDAITALDAANLKESA